MLSVFQDANVNALRSSFGLAGANGGLPIYLKHRMVSGTTSATTFSFRCGGNSGANAITVGGYNGAGIINSAGVGLIVIKELNA